MKRYLSLLLFLFVTCSLQAQNVGIGTTNPRQKLDVAGAVKIGNTSDALSGTIRWNGANADFEGYNGTAWKSLTGKDANVPLESVIAFSVWYSNGSHFFVPAGKEVTVPFSAKFYDVGNNFSLSSSMILPNTFMAPVDGIYHFDAAVFWGGLDNPHGHVSLFLKKNGSGMYSVNQPFGADAFSHTLSVDVRLKAGDKITLGTSHTTSGTRIILMYPSVTRFSGRCIARL
jgi:hypothetical protein